jgi:hypothetical protein
VTDAEVPARPALTISEAASACGVNRRTIRRRLDAGAFPSAYRDEAVSQGPAPWRIPVEDLLGAGLRPHAPTPPTEAAEGVSPGPVTAPGEVERLRAELAEERARRRVAEAVAEEREKALEDARLALRALTAGPPEPAPETPASPPPETISGRVRRWWRR